jgi:hypothetical protein
LTIQLQLHECSNVNDSAKLTHWYNEGALLHQRAREIIVIQIFHILLENKLATTTKPRGEAEFALKGAPRSSKGASGKPPSAKDSSLKWAAATVVQKSRDAASLSLTPAAHTAAWCEHALLEESSGLASFNNLRTLRSRIMALGINVTGAKKKNSSAIALENPIAIALRKFIASLEGRLENSVFEEESEPPVLWRVAAVGVDEETKQRVAYYYREDYGRTSDGWAFRSQFLHK